MFCLTHQERKALLFVGVLILTGSLLRFLKITAVKNEPFYSGGKAVTLKNSHSKATVDINKASKGELESISGIGEVIAGRIIEYRTQFGPFANLDDLKKVKGVGEKKIESIKDQISF